MLGILATCPTNSALVTVFASYDNYLIHMACFLMLFVIFIE